MSEAPTERLEVHLLATAGLVRRVYNLRFDALGLNLTEAGLLQYLSHEQPLTQSDLAQRLHIGRMAAGTVVKGLLARGLLDRSRDPNDARAWRISLTSAGDELATACMEIDRDVVHALRADLSLQRPSVAPPPARHRAHERPDPDRHLRTTRGTVTDRQVSPWPLTDPASTTHPPYRHGAIRGLNSATFSLSMSATISNTAHQLDIREIASMPMSRPSRPRGVDGQTRRMRVNKGSRGAVTTLCVRT